MAIRVGMQCYKTAVQKNEPKDTVSLIDMNHLKQKIGLSNAQGNPQEPFEPIAAIENQLKTEIPEAEKVAMVIEKLPVEYQSVLTAEMRKEGTGITSSHIESAAFQHWRTMYGSFASNPMIDTETTTTESNKEVCSVECVTGVESVDIKKQTVIRNNTSMDKLWEPSKAPTVHST